MCLANTFQNRDLGMNYKMDDINEYIYIYISLELWLFKNLCPLFIVVLEDKLHFGLICVGEKGPNLYTRPWTLFDDVDTSKKE